MVSNVIQVRGDIQDLVATTLIAPRCKVRVFSLSTPFMIFRPRTTSFFINSYFYCHDGGEKGLRSPRWEGDTKCFFTREGEESV